MLYLKKVSTDDIQKEYTFVRDMPEDEIYLRVNRDNPASLKVMLKNGGSIHHEDENKYYVRIKNGD